MSLFLGNLAPNIDKRELEKAFSAYGKCRINLKGKYGFAEFDKEEDAEEAKEKLQGKKFSGERINIEWSKKSGKQTKREKKPRSRSGSPRRKQSRGSRSSIPKAKDKSRSRKSRSRSHGKKKEGSPAKAD